MRGLKVEMPDVLMESIKQDTKTYIEWLNQIEPVLDAEARLTDAKAFFEYPVWPRHHDNFHYPLGMKKLLSLGFAGIRDSALQNANKYNGNQKRYLILIHEVYKAITDRIVIFAKKAEKNGRKDIQKVCFSLTKNAPQTFKEACQLYWFATIFRIGTSTIGRIDQHLYPFYMSDIEKGLLDSLKVKSIIEELLGLYDKRGDKKGDTLQNLTLSGKNHRGEDQTNPLTYMILEASLANDYLEPKINVRVHRDSPQYLYDLISSIQYKGTGNCTVFNDDAIIDGLVQYGRPSEIACDYCADGCSEIILDGYGETQFRYIDCVKAVEHVLFNGQENVPQEKQLQYYSNAQEYLEVHSPVKKGRATGEFIKMATFDEFYRAYLDQLRYQLEAVLREPYNSEKYPMRLFTAATMPGVLESAIDPYSNPSCYHTHGLFIGSLGTAVNSLAAIKSLVYEKGVVSREELISALKQNYEDQPILRQRCKDAPKFGNDNDYVDKMAVDIAERFAAWVGEYKDRMGRPILPGLYNHLFHHTAYCVGATPDGRKYGDPIGEHLSPTPGTAFKGPTSIINSVCKINTGEQIFGSTLHLSIPKLSFLGIDNVNVILTALIKSFCSKRGCVVNLSVLDTRILLDAQNHPEKYEYLMVRVWGFSYYFTHLSKEMQDHVIARYENKWVD